MSTYGQERGAATRKTVQIAREPVLEKLVIPDLIAMADAGKAYALVGGTGVVFGAWVIQRVQETGSVFIAEGIARRVDFTLELARVDDYLADPSGGAGSGGNPEADDDDFWDWWML